jgi:hypothetical protein
MKVVSSRTLSRCAAVVAALTTVLAVGCVLSEILGPGPATTSADPDASAGGPLLVGIQASMAAAFAVLGAVVVSRQPRNPVGWLLVCIGFFFVTIGVCNELYLQVALNAEGGPDGLGPMIWPGNWAWVFAMVPAVTFLPLLFPTGRPVTPRWRKVGWLAAAGIAGSFVRSAFDAGPLDGADAVDNPFGVRSPLVDLVGAIGTLCLLPAIAASIVSLVLRFRRASGAERQQVKWVASAALLLPVAATGLGLGGDASWPLVLVAMSIVAAAVTVAMLRYRLYDIDVVINRALVYGSLTATLAAVYVGSVLLLQLALSGLTQDSGLAVAASTLAVAGLFRPVRSRIQGIVDRRFFRSRYDARRTLEAFGARRRDEVDLHELSVDLRAVVTETMRPAHVSLWLRPSRGAP